MTVLRGAAIERFVRGPPRDIVCALIYGADDGAVRETAKSIVQAVAGSLDDPFAVAALDDRQLVQDPGRLADEFGALSLTGARKAIWIRDAGAGVAKALEPLLASALPGNLIVAEAEELQKSSRLRIICESSERAGVIALYGDNERDIQGQIDRALRGTGLSIAADARSELVTMLGAGRLDARHQLDKLVTYCRGQLEITLLDVRTCCADEGEIYTEELIDSALEGDLERTESYYRRLVNSDTPGSRLLTATLAHLARLQRLRLEIDRGKPLEAAVKGARPPIFFQRQAAILRQLKDAGTADLAAHSTAISQAIRQCREFGALEESVAGRAFLALARAARSRRSGAAR